MAFLKHNRSREGISKNFNLFGIPDTEIGIDSTLTEKIYPTTFNVGGYNEIPLEFEAKGQSESYIDLNDTYLMLDLCITKPNGGNLVQADNISFINQIGSSLFKCLEVFLNNQLITTPNHLYHYKCYIESLLNFNSQANGKQLELFGVAYDTPGHFEASAQNQGYVKRNLWTRLSRTYQVIAKVNSEIFNQNKYLVNNVDVKIKFHRNTNGFCILAPNNDTGYKIKIQNAALYITRIFPSSALQLSIMEAREKQNIVYNLNKIRMSSHLLTPGAMSYSFDLLSTSILPNYIIIGFVPNENSNYDCNPFEFQNLGITNISIMANTRQIPHIPFTPKFAEGLVKRELFSLYQLCGKDFRDTSLTIDENAYINGSTLFPFKLSNLNDENLSLCRTGQLRLNLNLGANLATAQNCIVYMSYSETLEADKFSNFLYSNI